MLNNLEFQARMFFFLRFVKEHPEATSQVALEFTERCWQEFLRDTQETWLDDIRELMQEHETPVSGSERCQRAHARVAHSPYAGLGVR